MANTKISDFTSGAPTQATDEFVIARSGSNYKLSASDIQDFMEGSANTFTEPQIVSVDSASTALRITQVGAGNALVVEDEANPDSSPFVVSAIGNVGVGTSTPFVSHSLEVSRNVGGNAFSAGIISSGVIQSDASSRADQFLGVNQTSAGTFGGVRAFQAQQGTISGTLAQQVGFAADASLTAATTNIGFLSELSAASGRWNFFASGTAKNYFAGSVGIGVDPDASAALDVASTTQGILFPRMTEAQRDLISSPANGLVVYNTTTDKLQVRAAGSWVDLH